MNRMNAPEGWESKRFDEFGTIFSGSTPSTSIRSFWDGDIVWITPYDLSRLKTPYLSESSKRITEKGLNGCSAHLLPPGSVVMSSRAPIGYVALPTVPFCTNQGCKTIKLKSIFHSEFAYYNIIFNINKIKKLGEGTTFAEISKAALATVELPFPNPFSEQTKIAQILSTVDRAIEQTEALIDKQQRIKTGLMQDLLTRGIDEHGNLRSEQTHHFKDSPLGRIPVEWEVKRLDEITSKIADRDHTTPVYVEDGVLIVSPTAFYNDESIAFDACPRITRKAHLLNSRKTDCRPRDIILHRIGAGLGRVRVVAEEHPEFSILHSLAVVRPKVQCTDTSFLKWAFRSYELQKQMVLGTQSIGVPDLGLDKIGALFFKIPESLDEQKKIGKLLNSHQRLLDDQFRGVEKLRSLKTALMQDLLTGKKRVTPLLESELKRE